MIPTIRSSLSPLWAPVIWVITALLIGRLCPVPYKSIGKLSVAVLLGMAWCSYRAWDIQLKIPEVYLNKPVITLGRVVSFPEYQPGRFQCEYIIEQIDEKPCKPTRVLLTQYSYGKSSLLSVKRGEYWKLPIRLKKPRGFWNPGSFDYQAWLLQRGITVTGTLVQSSKMPAPSKQLSKYTFTMHFYSIMNDMHQWRIQLGDRICQNIHHPQYAGLLQALVIGMRHEILPPSGR